MKEPTNSKNDDKRLEVIRSLKFTGHRTDDQVTEIVDFCSRHFDVPIVLVTIVEENKQLFYANKGLEHLDSTPREIAFCNYTIEGNDLMEVQDAHFDERFAKNPLVTDDPHIRFYAGVPINVNNEKVGALCLIDRDSRKLNEKEKDLLQLLTNQIEYLLIQKEKSILHLELIQDYHIQLNKLRTSKTQLQNILSAISHDAVGPVKSARSLLGLASNSGTEEVNEVFKHAEEALNQSENMLNELIAWGIANSKSTDTDFREINFLTLFYELQNELQDALEQKGNKLHLELGAIQLNCSPMRLKFIIRNLIINANKFSHDSTIVIRVKEDEGVVIFEVEDHGIGMTPAQLADLNRYSPSESSKGTSGEKGHGLGVHLSHQFAREIKGTLHFESELNKGTIAQLRINQED